MQAHVTANSQSFRLRERATEADIRHGQEVRVDMPHVRVGAVSRLTNEQIEVAARGEIFFCNMGRIRVREIVAAGDGARLPDTVITDGIDVPEPGFYDLLNVLVHSNGDIRVIADAGTRIQPSSLTYDEAWF